MKKIVLLYLGRKGAGPVYSYEMARALSKKCKVFVFLSAFVENKASWESEAAQNPNIEISLVTTYTTMLQFLFSFLRIFTFFKIAMKINRLKPDILYSTMPHFWDAILFPLIKCSLKVKTIHDASLHDGESNFLLKFFHRFVFRQADKYVILSNSFKSDLTSKGIDVKDIIVIPHAVFDYYKNIDQVDGEKKFQFFGRILFFGRIVKYKGLGVLLDAMSIILETVPDLKLLIAGDGDIEPYMEKIKKFPDNIELHFGWVSDERVGDFFSEIDFLVLPYTQASQSGVIPLSYGFSKPVVASAVGGIPEQVKHMKTGILVEPGNVRQLADSVVLLISDQKLLQEMSCNCRDFVDKELTWHSSAEKLLSGLGMTD